jgi:DNA-binding CsgD family transcriptional regulator
VPALTDTDLPPLNAAESLFGRRLELALIQSFLDGATVSGGALLLLGEPGVGKTALLNAAAEAAMAAETQVVRAAGVEFEADVGFSGLNQALFPISCELDQLSAPQRHALSVALGLCDGAAPDRLVVFTAALTLLRQAAATRPVLMIVDDIQWLDRSSATALGFVARRLDGSRVGLLAASRAGTESFFDLAGIPAYDLQPLDDENSARVVGARFPTLAPHVRRRVLSAAQGNPLALLELPAAMSDPQRSAAEALPSVLPVDRRLRTLFAARISELPARTRHALLLMALEGSADLRVLTAAPAYLDLDDLVPAEQVGLVHLDEGARRLDFRHPLIPAAVVELSTSAEQRLAHRALADALSDQPERRAWHLAEATIGSDEEVASLLEHAAHRVLRRGDAVGAVAALLRAADLSPQGANRAQRLAEAAHVGADVTGDLRNVSRWLVDARRADPERGGSLQAAAAAAYVLLNGEGDVDTAHRLLVGAIETQAAGYDADDHPLTEALHALLMVCYFGGSRPDLWAPFHEAVGRLRPRPPVILALCGKLFGDPARATLGELDQLDVLISGLYAEVDPGRIVRVGTAASFVDRVAGCREALWRVVEDGRRGGAVASAIRALMQLSFDDIQTGRWREAGQLADEALALCGSRGYRLQVWPFLLAKALVAARRGDDQTTQALTEQMIQWAGPRGLLLVRSHSCHARALAALGLGEFERAYEHAAAISPPGTLASHAPLALWAAMDLVEAAAHTERPAEAAAHAAAMREAGIAALSPRLALLTRGSAAIAAPKDRATELFEEALATPGVGQWPFDLARVRLAFGEHLRRTGAIAEARTQLAAALQAFESLGARPWASRAGNELQARGPAAPPAEGAASSSLTPQQLEIATLAATGLSNKEIGDRLYLSHRTVGAHLYRIYPKLGINSRAGLADALQLLQSSQ